MVVVCEDTVVAPTYLRRLKAEVLPLGYWTDIAVYPLPPSEIGTAKNDNPQKSPRKIKALLAGQPGANVEAFEIEPEYRAQPTRYVREAQKRLESSGHDEGWAVYDLDGHAAQEQAHILSLTDPVVGIAFCSIAIEHWFLLHYERDNTAYPKSENVPLGKHIPGYTKNNKGDIDVYQPTRPHLDIAIENAAWLRTQNASNPSPFYRQNPYIEMDRLINSLFNHHEEIVWIDPAVSRVIASLTITAVRTGPAIEVSVANTSAKSIVSNEINIYWLAGDRTRTDYAKPNVPIEPGATWQWREDIPSPGLLNLTIGNNRLIVPL
jgi:hypothetical protein